MSIQQLVIQKHQGLNNTLVSGLFPESLVLVDDSYHSCSIRLIAEWSDGA